MFENCKGCMSICGTANKPQEPEKCAGYIPKTNGNVMRRSSDEDLVDLFCGGYYDGPKFHCPVPGDCQTEDCSECFRNWLKSLAEEEQA